MHSKTTWLWWSTGKDSAWALHTLRSDERFDVVALVTTVNAVADRVAMHAVRTSLLRAQSNALRLPLRIVEIPDPCPEGAYEAAAGEIVREAEREGVSNMAFGDLFQENVRAFREDLLASSSIKPTFPLWGMDTHKLATTMIRGGVTAHLTCVDPKVLDPSWVGRGYDQNLLEALPATVDPCGENGEFHTFVSNAPGFSHPLPVVSGEIVERNGVFFADMLPASQS